MAELDLADRAGGDAPTTGWSWLMVHPAFWVAVTVLVLNDRALKRSFPGVVTGKLSDVAGVVMVTLVAVALTSRVRTSIAATALMFGVLKTVPAAAVWAVPVLGGRTRTDPSDLVALVALVPLGVWLWRRRVGRETTGVNAEGAWRLVARVAALSVAVLATSATSCAGDPFFALWVLEDGTIVEGTEGGGSPSYLVVPVRSDETTADGDYLAWKPYTGSERLYRKSPQTRACTDDGFCAVLRGLSIVEIGPDGSEKMILNYNGNRYKVVSHTGSCGDPIGDVFPDVVSNGSVLVVAMGPIGAMVRTPDGEWLPTGRDGAVPSIAK